LGGAEVSAVPPGYKQTEVGVIPEEWEVHPFGKLAQIERGKFTARPRNDPRYYGGEIPFIQTGDVTNANGHITTYSQTLNAEGLKVSKLFSRGTLFFTIAANIGDVGFATFDAACPDSLVAITPTKNTDKKWLSYELAKRKASFESIATHNAQLNINLEKLRPYLLPLPPLPEQRAIAGALGDVDGLIESLEKLIFKKRDLKQGAMQQLLTGKKRLPGFREEWEVKAIHQLAEVGRGRVISHIEISKSTTPLYPVFSSQTSSNGVMGYIDTNDFEGDYVTWTTDGANAGTVFARSGKFNCTNVCGTIKLHDSDHRFIAAALGRVTQRHVSRHLGNPKLMNDIVKKIEIRIPATRAEQTAIATILSDMDAEIQGLETKLTKTRLLKQGMMQELLTGRIRLVESGPTDAAKKRKKP
jgi:type I restriction enzyme S subunit